MCRRALSHLELAESERHAAAAMNEVVAGAAGDKVITAASRQAHAAIGTRQGVIAGLAEHSIASATGAERVVLAVAYNLRHSSLLLLVYSLNMGSDWFALLPRSGDFLRCPLTFFVVGNIAYQAMPS